MSLEARMELLTAAVIELTAAIGTMQAPGPESEVKKPDSAPRSNGSSKSTEKQSDDSQSAEAPNDQPSSTDTTYGQPSAPTGESSSQEPTPELDYAKDVKPATLKLSKEKGREVTIAVLARFGVKGAQELDPDQWAAYIAHCDKVLAGGEV